MERVRVREAPRVEKQRNAPETAGEFGAMEMARMWSQTSSGEGEGSGNVESCEARGEGEQGSSQVKISHVPESLPPAKNCEINCETQGRIREPKPSFHA
jgi:hypothetical protein